MASPQFNAPDKLDSVLATFSTAADGASDHLDIGGYTPVGLVMPGAWTSGADILFEGNTDGSTTYYSVYGTTGDLVVATIGSTAPSRYIALDPTKFYGLRSLRLVSGVSTAAVPQAAAREVRIALRGFASD